MSPPLSMRPRSRSYRLLLPHTYSLLFPFSDVPSSSPYAHPQGLTRHIFDVSELRTSERCQVGSRSPTLQQLRRFFKLLFSFPSPWDYLWSPGLPLPTRRRSRKPSLVHRDPCYYGYLCPSDARAARLLSGAENVIRCTGLL